MERFLIAFVLSVKVLAFYAVPFDILSKISILPFSAAAVLFPSFSYSSGKQRLLKSLFFRPIKYLLFLATPVYITLFIFAKDILGLWMGRDFAQSSAHVFQILTIAFFVNIFSYIPFSAIQGLGRPELKAKLDLVQIPIFLALCLYLIPSFGLVGAAFAKLLITLIDTFGLLWFSKKVLFLSISDLCFLQPGGRAYSKRKFPWPTRKFQL
jgi:O-antigen/teichoic acid export membrane protein